MKRNYYLFFILILWGFITSCESDIYSCDPFANDWIKQNLSEVQKMTRNTWLKLDERESVRRAAYVAFKPHKKQEFWENKIIEVINDFDWNNEEKTHLGVLLKYIRQTNIFNENETSEDFELFIYKWNEYAIQELNWSRKLIYGITADGNRLLNKSGDLEKSSDNLSDKTRIKTNSEDSGLSECSCSQLSDWCDIFGEIPPWVLSCNSYNYNCKEIPGCGTFWKYTCDGICKAPTA